MFAALCMGLIFATMATTVAGGLMGSITDSLTKIKGIKDAWGGIFKSKEEREREKEEKEEKEVEKKKNELQKLLKKKKEDLSPRERKQLEKLVNDKSVDWSNELGPKELKLLNDYTGKSIEPSDEEPGEEPKEEEPATDRNKLLALMQRDLKEHENDDSEEARNARMDYEDMAACMFDENGEPVSDEEFTKNVNNLPAGVQERIQNNISKASENSKNIEQLNEQKDDVSPEEIAAAVENAKATSLNAHKQMKLADIEKKEKEELAGLSDEEKIKEIKDRYNKEREGVTAQFDARIEEHKSKAAEHTKALENKQVIKAAQEEKEKLEKQKDELEGDVDNTKLLDKYANFEFRDGLTPGSLDDPVNKEKAEEQLKEAGLDPELFRKVQERKSRKGEDGNEPSTEELMNDLGEDIAKDKKRQIGDVSKKISDKDNVIKNNGEPKKEEPKAEPKKEGEPEPEPEPKKEGEPEPEPKPKKEAKPKKEKDTNDDETEEETKNSTFDDGEPEDDEVDDKGNSKKDPRKVYKQKSYKRGDKTFRTKSYYDKKGNSISAKEMKEKIKNYNKQKKQAAVKESLLTYINVSCNGEASELQNLKNYILEKLG